MQVITLDNVRMPGRDEAGGEGGGEVGSKGSLTGLDSFPLNHYIH